MNANWTLKDVRESLEFLDDTTSTYRFRIDGAPLRSRAGKTTSCITCLPPKIVSFGPLAFRSNWTFWQFYEIKFFLYSSILLYKIQIKCSTLLFVKMVVQIKSDMELCHTQNIVYSKEEHWNMGSSHIKENTTTK